LPFEVCYVILVNEKGRVMRKIIFIVLIVCSAAGLGYAQERGDWYVGIGGTLFGGGTMLGMYVNQHLNARWQVGVMPFARIYNFNDGFSKNTSTTLGLNVNSRFYLARGRTLLPYAYTYGGYGESYNTFEYPTSITKSTDRFFNASLGLGVQVLLGEAGWSVDANMGYLGYFGLQDTGSFNTYIYSIGLFKRFGKKRQ